MSDALRIPSNPNLGHYRELAKELQRACEANSVRAWAERWAEADAEWIAHHWQEHAADRDCSLANARDFLARIHGFASWPEFTRHVEEIARAQSPVSRFETAADAIAGGDIATLSTLLREHPELVRERSTREHRSTLLHYVSANGIEDYRQKTPQNIVEIAKLLLDAGADVNAESDAYGGHSTALNLTATSWHPHRAGVQIALMELLIGRGAVMNDTIVNDCLANGRGAAAEDLAARGAKLDLEGAAGVGRLDLVETLFESSSGDQRRRGLNWACEFGRIDVVRFLTGRGVTSDRALHWAAHEAHLDIVKLLLESGASKDARDKRFDGTPLDWALHGREESEDKTRYDAVIAALTA